MKERLDFNWKYFDDEFNKRDEKNVYYKVVDWFVGDWLEIGKWGYGEFDKKWIRRENLNSFLLCVWNIECDGENDGGECDIDVIKGVVKELRKRGLSEELVRKFGCVVYRDFRDEGMWLFGGSFDYDGDDKWNRKEYLKYVLGVKIN